MALTIYAVVATVVAVVAIIKAVKWKIATRAMVVYCTKNFRIPTDKELADCSKEAPRALMALSTMAAGKDT